MKNNIFSALFSSAMILLCGCAGILAPVQEIPMQKVKVGYFVDNGSRGNGVFQWAQLLHYSPQLEVTLLDGKDIREGKLAEIDLLFIPGGSSTDQMKSLQDAGKDNIRKFVYNGGAYVGICAGFHCTLDRQERLQIMPYKYLRGAGGAQARLAVDISEKGGKILNARPGRRYVYYSRGPISRPAAWAHGNAETLGVYKSTVGPFGRDGGRFFDAPAIISGNYGKGKVIATSFHPEAHVNNRDISMGCIYAVTGVKAVPEFPRRNSRPVRVAFVTGTTGGKEPIRRMLELDRHPDLDVIFTSNFTEGILDHVDVLVIPDAHDLRSIEFIKANQNYLQDFMDRGGRILASGVEAQAVKAHRNLVEVPAGQSFVPGALGSAVKR